MRYKVQTVKGVQVGPARKQGGVVTDPGFRFVEDHYGDEDLETRLAHPTEEVELQWRGWRLLLQPGGTWSVKRP